MSADWSPSRAEAWGTLRAPLPASFWEGIGGAVVGPATCALAPRLGAVTEAVRSGPRQLRKLSSHAPRPA